MFGGSALPQAQPHIDLKEIVNKETVSKFYFAFIAVS
jgi:hypothetical protein